MKENKIISIKDAIKQKAPFKHIQQETTIALLRTSAQLRNILENGLEIKDLSMQQYNILRILRGAGKAIPIMDVSNRLVEPTPGITRLIKKLETKNLINRVQCIKDKRVFYVEITKEGLKLLESLQKKIDALDKSVFGSMSPKKLRTLISLLDEVRSHFNIDVL